jgi:rhodanese-related sulfurtransferase
LINQLAASELAAWREDAGREPPLVVDVREPWEYKVCHIDGALLIPLGELTARARELPHGRELVMVCHHGVRSLHAAGWLLRAGYSRVHNLRGGVAAWAAEVDPTMPRY